MKKKAFVSGKKIFLILLLTFIFSLFNGVFLTFSLRCAEICNSVIDEEIYDTVIIGAGLAGLTAAYELKDKTVLILEKENTAGGRVLTRSYNGISYDLGAVFRIASSLLPFPVEKIEAITETGSVCLFYNDEFIFGKNLIECADSLPSAIKSGINDVYLKLSKGDTVDFKTVNAEAHKIINSFFQLIHSGNIEEYIPVRCLDAYAAFDVSHYVGGNKIIIDEYLKRLGANGCEFLFDSRVHEIEDEHDKVKILYVRKGVTKTVRARSVIVTVPADNAKKIIKKIEKPTAEFLESITYGDGIVVAIGVKKCKISNFAYMLLPHRSINSIIKQKTINPLLDVLYVYYTGDKAKKYLNTDGSNFTKIINDTLLELSSVNVIDTSDVVFSDIYNWKNVSPVINKKYYDLCNIVEKKTSRRVFLSGEYIVYDKNNFFPYGAAPAIRSGKLAAENVKIFLNNEIDTSYSEKYLLESFIYELHSGKPVYRNNVEECNVAFYGPVLSASRDEKLLAYLLSSRRKGLWEYQHGFGVTSEDSAMVLEGLLNAGLDKKIIKKSLDILVKKYFDKKYGAFKIVLDETQKIPQYWVGPSVDATALIGWIMASVDSQRYLTQINSCAAYIAGQQYAGGEWRGKWFHSHYVTTLNAIRLLSFINFDKINMLKTVNYILSSQSEDGSWDSLIVSTSAAIMTLKYVDGLSPGYDVIVTDKIKKSIGSGRKWLLDNNALKGRYGEPLLYYWLENQNGNKIFHHSVDRGKVTAAWAKLAIDYTR